MNELERRKAYLEKKNREADEAYQKWLNHEPTDFFGKEDMISIHFNGQDYVSLSRLIDELNKLANGEYTVTKKLLMDRLKNHSLEELVANDFFLRKMQLKVQYKDKTYDSLKQLTEVFDINYSTLLSKISNGMPLEEAVEDTMARKKPPIEFEGKEYKHLADLARAYDMPTHLLNSRYKKTNDLTKAIYTNRVLYQGKVYYSYAPFVQVYGKEALPLYRDLSKGMTEEEADRLHEERLLKKRLSRRVIQKDASALKVKAKDLIAGRQAGYSDEEIVQKYAKIRYENKTYRNYRELLKDFPDVNYDTFMQRIRSGKSIDEALHGSYLFKHEGIRYQTVKELSEAFHVTQKSIKEAIRSKQDLRVVLGVEQEATEVEVKQEAPDSKAKQHTPKKPVTINTRKKRRKKRRK